MKNITMNVYHYPCVIMKKMTCIRRKSLINLKITNIYAILRSCLVNIYSNFLLTIEYNDTFWKALVEIEKYYKISTVTTV